jgi:hypothetical protein
MWWTVLGFRARAAQWAEKIKISTQLGPKAYATKQQALWSRFADEAKTRFTKAIGQYLGPNHDLNELIDYMAL